MARTERNYRNLILCAVLGTAASAAPVNALAASGDAHLLVPVDGKIGETFGPRVNPNANQQSFHKGEDFLAPVGTVVKASAGGSVILAEKQKGYGNIVAIDHGDGLVTRYAHLSKIDVSVGEAVSATGSAPRRLALQNGFIYEPR